LNTPNSCVWNKTSLVGLRPKSNDKLFKAQIMMIHFLYIGIQYPYAREVAYLYIILIYVQVKHFKLREFPPYYRLDLRFGEGTALVVGLLKYFYVVFSFSDKRSNYNKY